MFYERGPASENGFDQLRPEVGRYRYRGEARAAAVFSGRIHFFIYTPKKMMLDKLSSQ